MTPDQFYGLAAKLAGMTEEVVLHLLGEPLSHPELAGILSAAADAHLPVNIVTNGLLLTGERIELLLRPIVRQVSVSLQSFANNFPEQDPLTYVRRIKHFVDRAIAERPDLYINLRFWDLVESQKNNTNHNQDDLNLPLNPVLKHAEDSSNSLSKLRDAIATEFEFDWAGVLVDLRRRKSHRLKGRLYLHFDSRFVWPDLKNQVLQTKGFCHGLTGHFGIHADGTVVPCCLDHNADIPLGNAFETPIEDILNAPRATKIREGFARGELVEDLCKRCGYINRFKSKPAVLKPSPQPEGISS